MNRISERVNIAACLGFTLLILLPIGRAKGASENASKLLDMARKKFGTLTEAEEKLFQAVVNGELVDCSDSSEKNNDPNGAKEWNENTRVIRANCVAWLCYDREASAMVTHLGIFVKGARIDGELDLEFARISFPLDFEKSAFPGGINLRRAEIRELFLIGTHTGPIYGDSVNIEGSVFLRNGFKAEGEVRLLNATIGGNLECDGSQFINKEEKAINADGVNIEGSVFLRNGFKAEGEVNLLLATIGNNLDCEKGEFINPTGYALVAANSNIKGGVFLSNCFKAEGEVNLVGATISRDLTCIGGQFINKGADALNADGVNIEGSVFLRKGFKAEGEVNLLLATIGNNLDCEKGEFINPTGYALVAANSNIKGGVFLSNGFKAEGEVNLVGATISRDLTCIGGQFINKGADALNASGANIEGSVYLREGFKTEGEVNLIGATIGGQLGCTKGEFINPGRYALIADRLNVKGSVLLSNGFKAEGEVSLVSATIDSSFAWTDVNSPEKATLDLRSATIGTLYDDANSWPDPNKLFLHGLVYKEIHVDAPRGAESWINWLRRQPGFQPQPYEQLAAVLRKSGQDGDAREILIAKNKDRGRLTKLTWSEKWWYRVLGPMIGYGYRPLNALRGVVAFVALGWVLFGIGYWGGLVTPQNESAYIERSVTTVDGGAETRELSDVYPRFNFLVYSFDVFVPLIDLHQAKYWLPNANRGPELLSIKGFSLHTGGILRLYLWVHITMGWAITMLLVAGLTGLIRT